MNISKGIRSNAPMKDACKHICSISRLFNDDDDEDNDLIGFDVELELEAERWQTDSHTFFNSVVAIASERAGIVRNVYKFYWEGER